MLARGFEDIAHLYLRKARSCYLRWGADGKVQQLDDKHPQLSDDVRAPGSTSTIGTRVEQLDLATITKVSQAVLGEINPEKLVDTLLRTAIERAGAGRGLLIFTQRDGPRIKASAEDDRRFDSRRTVRGASKCFDAAAIRPQSRGADLGDRCSG